MDLRETPAQHALRQELRAYFAALLPDDERRAVGEAGAGGDRFREVVRMLGRDGWLGVGWPVEYGGRGMGAEEQFIFFDEIQRAGVPFPLVTVNTVGPTLMEYGTEEQKRRFLPGMLSRRHRLRHRLHRAGGRHRPGLARNPGGPRRRRLRRRRAEDLHHRRQHRRLRVAGLPHRPRRPQAQGHLDPDRAVRRPRLQLEPDPRGRRDDRHRHLLLRHPRRPPPTSSARSTAAGS